MNSENQTSYTILGLSHTAFIILITVLILLFAIGIYFAFSVTQVPNGKVTIVERFKKFKRALKPGTHIVLPFFEKAVCEVSVEDNDHSNTVPIPLKKGGTYPIKYKVIYDVTSPSVYYYSHKKIMSEFDNHLGEILIKHLSNRSKADFQDYIESVKKAALKEFETKNTRLDSIKITDIYINME